MRYKRLNVKEASLNKVYVEDSKGFISDISNSANTLNNNEVHQDIKNKLKSETNCYNRLMNSMLILDRSIYEYKFIFAQNLLGI